MEISPFYRALVARFVGAGFEGPDREARLVLLHAAGIDEATLIAEPGKILSPEQIDAIQNMAARRMAGEPLSRILGHREFYGLKFFLSAATLDPRPDTEHLVTAVLETIGNIKRHPREGGDPGKTLRLLDLGTGTGCIPISILKNISNITALAVDIDPAVADQARANAKHHNVDDRLEVRVSNWGEKIDGMVDIITSNPPYIPSPDIPHLDSHVTAYDPIRALDGGEDGFESFRAVLNVIKKHLNEDGTAFIEIGDGQIGQARRLVEEWGLYPYRTMLDYAGIPRIIVVRRAP